ncbi:hypothetical protein [Streptomyces fulvoviolaceus]|nr:hypothetical protein [Streptomyces fulvoviolaceus]
MVFAPAIDLLVAYFSKLVGQHLGVRLILKTGHPLGAEQDSRRMHPYV